MCRLWSNNARDDMERAEKNAQAIEQWEPAIDGPYVVPKPRIVIAIDELIERGWTIEPPA